MKRLFCLLMALLLLLALPSGNLISNDKPWDDGSGGGEPEDDPGGDDHPWGGDQVKPNDPKDQNEMTVVRSDQMAPTRILVVSFFSTFFDVYVFRTYSDVDNSTSAWSTQVQPHSNDAIGGSAE